MTKFVELIMVIQESKRCLLNYDAKTSTLLPSGEPAAKAIFRC